MELWETRAQTADEDLPVKREQPDHQENLDPQGLLELLDLRAPGACAVSQAPEGLLVYLELREDPD